MWDYYLVYIKDVFIPIDEEHASQARSPGFDHQCNIKSHGGILLLSQCLGGSEIEGHSQAHSKLETSIGCMRPFLRTIK